MSTTEIEIKKALLDAHLKQVHIARKECVSRSYVHLVIKSKRPSLRIRKAIAKAVKKRVKDLWPSGPRK